MERIEFATKNIIYVHLYKREYDFVMSVIRHESKDPRVQKGIIKTFSIIKIFTLLNPFSEYVPIHCDVFKDHVSGKNYVRYREILYKNHIIDFKESPLTSYKEKKTGKNKIKCMSPMVYRCNTMTYQGCKSIFDNTTETIPVKIELKYDLYKSLEMKSRTIHVLKMNKNSETVGKKSNNILATNNTDTYVSYLIVRLIKDIVNHKINSIITWQRRIRAIAKKYQRKDVSSIKDKEIIIEYLIIKVIRCLYNKKKEFEQIVDNFLSQRVKNQLVKLQKRRSLSTKSLSYYRDLSIDVDGLDYCISMKDILHVTRINTIPHFNKDGKLYSAFSNLRREIRKYVRYKGEILVEVSDIHSAHFTMLPLVFEKCHITIPHNEMTKFKNVTQKGDLYADVIRGTTISRDDIKPVFQSFFSIKNEKQYLFSCTTSEHLYREMICKYFKQNFPMVYSSMLEFHKSQNVSIKSVANKVESEIMNPICDRILNEGLHPFRLHDAIYMTTSEYNLLQVNINQLVYDTINHIN